MMLHTKYNGVGPCGFRQYFSRRWLFNKYIFNCILLSIDIHNAYICIQNSIGMFQVGVERWFVLSIEAI